MSYDWKRIATGQNHTILQHRDGHQLKVAHAKVSPDIRQKIEKFPLHMQQGGQAWGSSPSVEESVEKKSKEQQVDPSKIKGSISQTFGKSTPATDSHPDTSYEVKHPSKERETSPESKESADEFYKQYNTKPFGYSRGGEVAHYANGTENGPVEGRQPIEIHNHYYSSAPQSGVASEQQAIPPYLAQNAPAPQQPELGQNIQMPQPQQAPPMQEQPQPQSNDQFGYQQAIEKQMHGLEEQKAGQQEQEMAKAEESKGRLTSEQGALQQQEQAQYSFNQNLTRIHEDRMDLQYDIANKHLDPEHYLKSMSTGSKILTGLGLVFGGMGSGLTGGPNLAYEMLQKHISNDIDSQKAEIGKKENLLAHNFQEEGNLRSAMDMTRIQTNDVLSSHLKMEADKVQNQITKGRLLELAGKFDDESSKLQQRLALTKTMMGGVGNGADQESAFKKQMQFLRMQGQEGFAKDQEAKHVPGIGQASTEMPPDVRKELVSRQDLQRKIQDLQDFASKHSGSLDPSTIREGKTKASLVQDAYRRANGQGVFKEGEKQFVESIVGADPTQFFNKYRNGKAYKELGRDNESSLNSLKQGYGLPTTNSPQAPDIRTMNGVKYQKVQGGWQKVK